MIAKVSAGYTVESGEVQPLGGGGGVYSTACVPSTAGTACNSDC